MRNGSIFTLRCTPRARASARRADGDRPPEFRVNEFEIKLKIEKKKNAQLVYDPNLSQIFF